MSTDTDITLRVRITFVGGQWRDIEADVDEPSGPFLIFRNGGQIVLTAIRANVLCVEPLGGADSQEGPTE